MDFNPAREIKKPKGQSLHGENEEIIILKPDEIRALLEEAATQKDKVLFMTAVLTGAREGELIGLQWGDVNWLNSQLHIRRTFNHGKFMEPKSKASRRKIAFAPKLVHELKKWKLACPKGGMDLVSSTEDEQAFCHQMGAHPFPNTLNPLQVCSAHPFSRRDGKLCLRQRTCRRADRE